MGARVDKTESAVGVTRALLNATIAEADWNKPIAVGLNASGKVVKGAGQTGIIGVCIFDRTNCKAGTNSDIFGNGTEIVGVSGLAAGTKYYGVGADGTVSATASGNTYLGYTVEADRLVLSI